MECDPEYFCCDYITIVFLVGAVLFLHFYTEKAKELVTLFAVFRIIAAAMLLWGTQYNPSSYYIFLRWIVFGVSWASVLMANRHKYSAWVVVFVIIGLLFNPVIPVHLHSKSTWTLINVIAAGLYLSSMVIMKNPIKQISNGDAP